MQIDTPRQYFEQLARHGRNSYLGHVVRTWEFDIDSAGFWRVEFDHGDLRVVEGRGESLTSPAGARVHMTSDAFVRLARGEGHENVTTAVLRGALVVEGDVRAMQCMKAVLPVPAEWESAS